MFRMKRLRRVFNFLKRRKRLSLVILIVLVILAVIFRPQQAKPIETRTVKKGNIVESLSATGTVYSTNSVDLNFLTGGKLVFVGVKRGERVEERQTIATLDRRTTQKNLELALRNYSIQRNTFEQTKDTNGKRTPQEALNDTMKRILENNQFDLEKAVISVELQDLAKEQSVLTSPISGIVTRADVTTAGVNIGPTTTYSIADPANLLFRMDIDEADINRVRLDEGVKVTLDAFPNQPIDILITSIDFATHTTTTGGNAYTVEAAMPDNSNLAYRIGMNGDVEIISSEKPNVLMIPQASVANGDYVYVKSGDEFKKRKVSLGVKNDTDVEVISGLKEGEKVALDPTEAEKVKKKRFLFF